MPQLASRASHLENSCMNPGTSHFAVALAGLLWLPIWPQRISGACSTAGPDDSGCIVANSFAVPACTLAGKHQVQHTTSPSAAQSFPT